MWIIRGILDILSGENIMRTVDLSEDPPQETPAQKNSFPWPEDIYPFETMPRVALRLFPSQTSRITIIMPGYNSSGKKQNMQML